MTKESKREPNDPGFDRICGAAVKHDFPVNVLFWGNLDAGTALIDRHPDTRFISARARRGDEPDGDRGQHPWRRPSRIPRTPRAPPSADQPPSRR
jgi:hypothetical protein